MAKGREGDPAEGRAHILGQSARVEKDTDPKAEETEMTE
jgi:hypothetical protein